MTRWISLLCGLAFMAGCAEVEMRGLVTDENTGQPLPGATVRVGDRSTTTDLTGHYEFEVDESENPKQIMVHRPGYEAYVEDVRINEDRADEMVVDFKLRPNDERSSRAGSIQLPREERDDD